VAAQDQSQEIAAIKKVIEDETKAYTELPFHEVAKKFWILDDATFICYSDGQGGSVFRRKDDMLTVTEAQPTDQTNVEKYDYIFSIVGDMASVYHAQKVTIPAENITSYSHEIRTMQKVGGTWKIHNLTVLQFTPRN
jgi:hypothetical protein